MRILTRYASPVSPPLAMHRLLPPSVLALLLVSLLGNPEPGHAQDLRTDLFVTNGPVHVVVEAAGTIYIGGNFSRVGLASGGAAALEASGALLVLPEVAGEVLAVASDGLGGWYLGGVFTHVGGVPRSNVAHVQADQVVSSWDPNANGAVLALAVIGTTVYAGGQFSSIGGQARNRIAGLEAASGLATGWNPSANGFVHALAATATTVYAGGSFTTIGGQMRRFIAAIDATTGSAAAWPNANSDVLALAVAGNGATVYAGGNFSSIGGQLRSKIAALDATTGLATVWNPTANSSVLSLAVSGEIVYAGGGFTIIGGAARNRIAALDATSGIATAWNPDANGSVTALAPSGATVYAGGGFTMIGGLARNYVAALDASSGIATSWNPNPNFGVATLAVDGTTVFVGGGFTSIGGQSRSNIAALDVASGLLTAWDPGANGLVDALAVSGGTVYAGGEFTVIGGAARSHIAALDATSGLATAWAPEAGGTVRSLAVSGTTVYAGGDYTSIGGAIRNHIAALDASGAATAWNPNADGTVSALALSGSTVYVGGGFLTIGGQPRNFAARLSASTGTATGWNPNANGPVLALAVSGTTVFAGGQFSNIGGQDRNQIAALDATTGIAAGWNPNANGTLFALATSGTSVYAGGDFTSIGGQARNRLAALDATSGLATGWNPNANSSVYALSASESRLYVAGNFTSIGGAPQAYIAGFGDVAPPPPPPPLGAVDQFPVTFSVNGPVDPHTEGVRDARGAAASAQVPPQPGNATGFGIRVGPVPQATGLASIRPGDVFDYSSTLVASDAIIVQSAPPTFPGMPQGGAPDGTNNQIIEAVGAGLVTGPGVASDLWTSLPPDAPERDNIDAVSFGEDYFPPGIIVGLDPLSSLPDPPLVPGAMPWSARDAVAAPAYREPIVLSDGPGIAFRFSVDPWAIGLPGTAVRTESGGADAGAGLGPWTSGGHAAGDVFNTPVLRRIGGVTAGATGNGLIHDNPVLALAPNPAPLNPMEDDIDALECVGTNTVWSSGALLQSGNVHGRVNHVPGPDLPPPAVSVHEPNNGAPVFFSVTRNSVGAPFTAVRSQFVVDGGAAGDIFVMVKDPADPAGAGLNLLFIDNDELGLVDFDVIGPPHPDDYTDDLDGLILRICPEYRSVVLDAINYIVTTKPWVVYGFGDAYTGPGMVLSITKYLGGTVGIPAGCIQVGFSVTTDAVGMAYTGVDWEAGPVDPPGGVASAAGDIFYAEVTGAAVNRNYLWYEEADLGLDAGSWVNGTSTNLSALADNLDALDSVDSLALVLDVPWSSDPMPEGVRIDLAPGVPNPLRSHVLVRYRMAIAGHVRITIHDVTGRQVAKLVDRVESAGNHEVVWEARDDDGGRVPIGLYFARATLGDQTRSTKLVVRR